jgi:magnesium and cobalt exporter, CNNM family
MFALEITAVFFLIVVNGLLAMSEMAIVSSRTSRLKAMVDQDVVGARRALALASDPGRFLSAVQIGITLVGVLSGAFSGATLGQRFSVWLMAQGLSQDVADAVGVGVVVVIITYASLIVGELVPKQIALRDPERMAVRVAPAMAWVARLTSPLVWLLDASGRLVLTVLRQNNVREERVTEEEIKTLIAEAESSGVLEPGEKEMIAGVLRLGDRNVKVVMTPRHDVDTISLSASDEAIFAALKESTHSRLPVFDTEGEVIGVVQAKDLLKPFLAGERPDIRTFIRHAPVIPDSADARDVIFALKDSPIHMGLVHDEYGHFRGLVTTADILGSIVGEFSTEEGPQEQPVVRRADGSLLLAGWMPLDELVDVTGIKLTDVGSIHTTAGFVVQGFGRLPSVGEIFETQGWRFEVLDLDGRRVDKVLATRLASKRRGR